MENKIGENITQPYYIEVKIVTGGGLGLNANLDLIKMFKDHGFDFKGDAMTQTNDDGISWSFLEKKSGEIFV